MLISEAVLLARRWADAKQFKFSGMRNNLEEIITCFLQKLPKAPKKKITFL